MESIYLQTGQTINARRESLAAATTDRLYAARPEISSRYGARGRDKCTQDALCHLDVFVHAIQVDSPVLFTTYIRWAKVMLKSRGIAATDLELTLGYMQEVLSQTLTDREMRDLTVGIIDSAREELARLPDILPTYLIEGEPLADLARNYLDALLHNDTHRGARFVLDAVKGGTAVKDIYLYVFQRTQREIGRLWQTNYLTIAEEHYCTAATQLILAQLYPYIFTGAKTGRRLIATCVNGELHELSARMVSDLFELAGWDTIYLGSSVPTDSVTDIVARHRADVLAISATLTTNVGAVATLIKAIRNSAAGANIKIMVGGYPFIIDPDLWRKVEADATAPDAESAVETANRLLGAGESRWR